MIRIVADTKCLAIPVRVSQRDGGQILLGVDTPEVTQRQWPVNCWDTNRTPEVNDLEAMFDKFRSLGGRKVTVNSSDGGFGSLVNVNPRDGLPFLRAVVNLSGSASANSCRGRRSVRAYESQMIVYSL